MGVGFTQDIVFIGFMTENIFRNVNTFRPFYNRETGIPLSKPRFTIKEGVLTLVPNPIQGMDGYRALLNSPGKTLKRIGADDFYYGPGKKTSPFDISPAYQLFGIIRDLLGKKTTDKQNAILRDNKEYGRGINHKRLLQRKL